MRISDWSSDVCSSDLRSRRCGGTAGSCSPTPSMARRSAAALPTSSPPTFNGSRNNGRRNKGLDPRRHGGARRERAGGRLLCQPRHRSPDFGRQPCDRRHDGEDRKSVVEGKGVSVRVDLGGRRFIKKKKKKN